MTDIVERLRDVTSADWINCGTLPPPICREAADEIEHLRQLVALAQELEREQSTEIDRLKAEIALLKEQAYWQSLGYND